MKDDAAKLVTGILALDEMERRNREERIEQELEREKLGRANDELRDSAAALARQNKELQGDADFDYYRANVVFAQNQTLNAEVEKLQGVLNSQKAAYEKQAETLADWMVSQKAFKELAIEFGTRQGLGVEEIIQMGVRKKVDVLSNKHDASHNTNIEGSAIVTEEIARKLKEKLELGSNR